MARAKRLGITDRDDFSLGTLANRVEAFGVKATAVGKALGLGCRLKLSGNHDYELLVNNGIVLAGRIEANGRRTKLFEGGTSVEATWSTLLKTIETEEKR